MQRRLWYAAYGSNLSRARFEFYLSGGRPPGAARNYPGARDSTPPGDDRPLILPGTLYFAWQSQVWGGGVAFYDPAAPGASAAARAYLLTEQQFSDIAAQEMHRPPGTDLDVYGLLAESQTATTGPGRYATLHQLSEMDGLPVVTFSAPWSSQNAPLNAPSASYLQLIAAGLRETHRWPGARIADYLLAAPGVDLGWDRAALTQLIAT